MAGRIVAFVDPRRLVEPRLQPYVMAGVLIVLGTVAGLLVTALAPVRAPWLQGFIKGASYLGLGASVVYFLFALGLLVMRPFRALLVAVALALLAVAGSMAFALEGPWNGILNLALVNSFSLFFVSGILTVYSVEDALEALADRFPRHPRLVPVLLLLLLGGVVAVAGAAGLRTLLATGAVGIAVVVGTLVALGAGRMPREDATPAYLLALTLVLLGGIGQLLLRFRPHGHGSGMLGIAAYGLFFVSLLYTALKMGRRTLALRADRARAFAVLLILAGVMSIVCHTQLAFVASGAEAFTTVAQAKFDYTLAGLFLGFLLYYARAIQDLGDAAVDWFMRRRERRERGRTATA